jgi:hypothetical protein
LAIAVSHLLPPARTLGRLDAGSAPSPGVPRRPGLPQAREEPQGAEAGELDLLLGARGELAGVAVGVAMRLRVEGSGRVDGSSVLVPPAWPGAGEAIVDAIRLPVGASPPGAGPAPARARAARAIAGYRRFAFPALRSTVSQRA